MIARGGPILRSLWCAAALFLSSGLLAAGALPVLIHRGPPPLAGLGLLLAMTWLGIGTACLAAAFRGATSADPTPP
jgi:hypothetical protein